MENNEEILSNNETNNPDIISDAIEVVDTTDDSKADTVVDDELIVDDNTNSNEEVIDEIIDDNESVLDSNKPETKEETLID